MYRSLPALLLGAILLTACDEAGPRTQVIYESVRGSEAKLTAEGRAGRPVPVFAQHAPFDSDGALAQRVAALLTIPERSLRFEGAGGGLPEPTDSPRVLILHDTPGGYTGISACQGKPYEPAPAAERIEIRAIVCDDAERLVEVLGVLPKEEGDQSAAYARLIEQAAGSLVVGEDTSPK